MAGSKKRETDTSSVDAGKKDLATIKEAGRNMRHGLYCDPKKVQIDGRSFFGKLKKKIKAHLLECFQGEASAVVQALAEGTAANMILARAFQAAYLRGDQLPPSILRDYVMLWNSVSRDLNNLAQLAKEAGAKDPIPSLDEYLKSKGAPLVLVESKPHDPKD